MLHLRDWRSPVNGGRVFYFANDDDEDPPNRSWRAAEHGMLPEPSINAANPEERAAAPPLLLPKITRRQSVPDLRNRRVRPLSPVVTCCWSPSSWSPWRLRHRPCREDIAEYAAVLAVSRQSSASKDLTPTASAPPLSSSTPPLTPSAPALSPLAPSISPLPEPSPHPSPPIPACPPPSYEESEEALKGSGHLPQPFLHDLTNEQQKQQVLTYASHWAIDCTADTSHTRPRRHSVPVIS